MSTTTEKTTEQTEAPATEQAPTPEQTEAQATQETEPTDKAGREAARYRRALRETEGALQAAQGAQEAAQRALVEHLAQARGIKPAALWASGAELSGLLDEGGHVDPAKVGQAIDNAMSSLGLSRTPKADPTQGGMGDGASPAPKFSDAFGPQ